MPTAKTARLEEVLGRRKAEVTALQKQLAARKAKEAGLARAKERKERSRVVQTLGGAVLEAIREGRLNPRSFYEAIAPGLREQDHKTLENFKKEHGLDR